MPDIFNSGFAETPPSKAVVSHFPKKIISNHSQTSKPLKPKEGETINIPEGYDIHSHPDHSHHPLTSFCFYPDKVEYVNMDATEKTILLLRKHPITNLPWVAVAFLMIIFPPFFDLLPLVGTLPVEYKIIITLCWYLIVIAFIIENFLSWFFNVDLITDERIMDIDFVNLMYREITEANLDEIQEVSVKPATGIYSFFHFGTVLIHTAAERPGLEFVHVPKAEKVAKILRELRIQEEIEEMEGRVR